MELRNSYSMHHECCKSEEDLATSLLIDRMLTSINSLEWHLKVNAFNRASTHLLGIISTHRLRECSDPRDKVYGFPGLGPYMHKTYKVEIEPDYSLPVSEAYEQFLLVNINHCCG